MEPDIVYKALDKTEAIDEIQVIWKSDEAKKVFDSITELIALEFTIPRELIDAPAAAMEKFRRDAQERTQALIDEALELHQQFTTVRVIVRR